VYRLTWRLPLAGLVAFSHLQFSQIRGRQPYSIVRKIPYLIAAKPLHEAWLVVGRRGGKSFVCHLAPRTPPGALG